MKLAWRAASLPEAQLIADLLRAHGIEAMVFNQNAQSVAGEIPPSVAGPQVWVADDRQLERARALADEFQRRPPPGSRRCPRCGEENPANFLSCWSCGEDA
jgi:hypothetical protein